MPNNRENIGQGDKNHIRQHNETEIEMEALP